MLLRPTNRPATWMIPAFFMFVAGNALATSSTVYTITNPASCTAAGFSWTGISNCVSLKPTTISSTTSIVVGPAVTFGPGSQGPLTVNGSVSTTGTGSIITTGQFMIGKTGSVTVSAGTQMIIFSSGSVSNGGVLNIAGTLLSYGITQNDPGTSTLSNLAAGTINNTGKIGSTEMESSEVPLAFSNSGTLNNAGTIHVTTVNNRQSSLTNTTSGTISNSGTINLNGPLNIQAGLLTNQVGGVIVDGYQPDYPRRNGSINNAAKIINLGSFEVQPNGSLTNTGTIENLEAGTLSIQGGVQNNGSLLNDANITGTGNIDSVTLQNDGRIANTFSGQMTFSNPFLSFRNGKKGKLLNWGSISLQGSALSNTGKLDNDGGQITTLPGNNGPDGSVGNATKAVINNDSDGTITNNGSLNNAGTLNTCGGTITGNAVQGNQPKGC